jgi:hypothetical protein
MSTGNRRLENTLHGFTYLSDSPRVRPSSLQAKTLLKRCSIPLLTGCLILLSNLAFQLF